MPKIPRIFQKGVFILPKISGFFTRLTPFSKGFRPCSPLKNPIFFRALRAQEVNMLLECILDRFPLSITPKPRFFRALRAKGGFYFAQNSQIVGGGFLILPKSPQILRRGFLPRGGVLNVNPPVLIQQLIDEKH